MSDLLTWLNLLTSWFLLGVIVSTMLLWNNFNEESGGYKDIERSIRIKRVFYSLLLFGNIYFLIKSIVDHIVFFIN